MSEHSERLARIEAILESQTLTLSRIDTHIEKSTQRDSAQNERLAKVETSSAAHGKVGWYMVAGILGLCLERVGGLFK